MSDSPHLWIVFTLVAAAAQTLRNATQRQLTATIGTAGATQVRFFFGVPFGLLFLAAILIATGETLPRPAGGSYWAWILLGGLAQTFATALMLAAMNGRSFVVVYAYIKTEPVQVALFGLILLGDRVTVPMAVAILTATAGVLAMSYRPGAEGGLRPTLLGLAAGGMFGLSAIGFRGAILTLNEASYLMAAAYSVVMGLALQAVLLSAWLWLRSPGTLAAIMRAWRPSLLAGFLGAFASLFWFLAFALATAASVRTVALVEVLFAQAISTFGFGQRTTRRELAGIVLIIVGVAALITFGT